MLDVTQAKYVSGYKIWLEFSNGESGVVDLEADLWGSVFEPLRDTATFKQFQVSPVLHTLVWSNGADFAPEHLYERMSTQSPHATRRAHGA